MNYKAEKTKELEYIEKNILTDEDINKYKIDSSYDIIFLSFPSTKQPQIDCEKYFFFINKLINKLGDESNIIIYADYSILPMLCYGIENSRCLFYKIWISIRQTPKLNTNSLPNETKGAVVFSKSKSKLNICKVRLPYTFCPACNKTTKDYGGKKHLFDEYGTLMSDVWKDIVVSPDDSLPKDVIMRFKDMFSVEPHHKMAILSLWEFNWKEYARGEIEMPLSGMETNISKKNDEKIIENQLVCGDVMEEITKIKTNSVDYIFVDPPYNLRKKYSGYHDDLEIESYFSWCDNWLEECYRVLKPGKYLSILNLPLWAARHYAYLISKMCFCSWITWDALSRPSGKLMPAHYAILTFQKPSNSGNDSTNINLDIEEALLPMADYYCLRESCVKKRVVKHKMLSDLWTDIYRIKHNSRRYDHPCQLPPTLLKRLISIYTDSGDTVLDCFNGVGTTTLCAHILNRNYIGIELGEKYHKIAVERHEDIEKGLDPFRKNDIPADEKVKNNEERRIKPSNCYKTGLSKRKVQLMVKDLANNLGRIPTLQDVLIFLDIPESFYSEHFKNWNEVVAATKKTGMTENKKEKN